MTELNIIFIFLNHADIKLLAMNFSEFRFSYDFGILDPS